MRGDFKTKLSLRSAKQNVREHSQTVALQLVVTVLSGRYCSQCPDLSFCAKKMPACANISFMHICKKKKKDMKMLIALILLIQAYIRLINTDIIY